MEETYDTFQAASMSNNRVDLPSSLQLTKFTSARCKEIEIMRKSLAASGSGTKVAFQRLPKHMRRRAMSHNAKRLPRRLREIHLSQMKKSGLPPKQRRPSRKYRRKPNNILKEYARRQSKVNWLNTHIWHAKRFHMIERWSYKLPHAPCDKSFRACYRATKNYCLLQDLSYFRCVEITGKKDFTIDGLKTITNTSGLSIGSKAFINGYRKGETTLYQYGTNCNKPIGSIEFLWRNNINVMDNSTVTLWLWIHAAFYEEGLKTLIDCFRLNFESEIYTNLDKSVEMKELKDELIRFRLTGHQSNKILHDCLKICNSENNLIKSFQESYGLAEEILKNQNQYWDQINSITSTNLLPPHIALPLIIHDPRMWLHEKQENVQAPLSCSSISFFDCPVSTASPLWDADLRKTVNSNKISNSDIAALRNSLLIPASNLLVLGDPVPIILMQRPGCRKDLLGYSSGWDIILPSLWALPIWISLIMSGARSGGLREFQQNTFETGLPDILYPDTLGGEKEEQTITEEYMKTYFRKPPNKRTNFNKFKITSPFKFNWKLLIENWVHHTVDNFVVIRDRKKLVELNQCIILNKSNILLPDNSLIPVQIECDKGVPKKFAIICLPRKADIEKVTIEPKNIDPNQNKRKLLRDQHKKLLKRLRRKRKNCKKVDKHIESTDLEEFSKYSLKMRELWIPEANNLRHSCSREVFGFIRDGGFSYTLGHAKGIGYIASASFNAFLNSNTHDKVLFRNTNSRSYYVAKLSVITDL